MPLPAAWQESLGVNRGKPAGSGPTGTSTTALLPRPDGPQLDQRWGTPSPRQAAAPSLSRKPAPPGLRPDTRKAKSPSGRRVPKSSAGAARRARVPTRCPPARRHLAQLLAAHGAVPLLAQHPHLGGAAVARRVVAAAQRRGLQVPAAQYATPAAPLRCCRRRRLLGPRAAPSRPAAAAAAMVGIRPPPGRRGTAPHSLAQQAAPSGGDVTAPPATGPARRR